MPTRQATQQDTARRHRNTYRQTSLLGKHLTGPPGRGGVWVGGGGAVTQTLSIKSSLTSRSPACSCAVCAFITASSHASTLSASLPLSHHTGESNNHTAHTRAHTRSEGTPDAAKYKTHIRHEQHCRRHQLPPRWICCMSNDEDHSDHRLVETEPRGATTPTTPDHPARHLLHRPGGLHLVASAINGR